LARGTCLRGTVKSSIGTVGAAISCGGQPIWPGDIIAADESGIVIMPPDQVEQILLKGEERSRKEAAMMSELRGGRTTMELLDLESKIRRD
jgi:4-hydroxy-4-methyl-2-oxoglutarate aldolase